MKAATEHSQTAAAGDTGTRAAFARILVGYCATAPGADALALGADISAAGGGEISLVSVLPTAWIERVPGQADRAKVDGGARERVARALEDAAATLRRTSGVAAPPRSVEVASSPARGLHDAASSQQADLIVVGSSHRGPIGRVLLGSVGERLLNGGPCAVAVAPRGYASRPRTRLSRVLVAFDGSPEARLGLQAADALTRHARASLSVVMVVVPSSPSVAVGEAFPLGDPSATPPGATAESLQAIRLTGALKRQESAARATLEAVTATLGAPVIERQVLVGPDPAMMILQAAGGRTDLLVLGSRAYGPLRRALLGSVSDRVIRRASCPVLVTPRTSERIH